MERLEGIRQLVRRTGKPRAFEEDRFSLHQTGRDCGFGGGKRRLQGVPHEHTASEIYRTAAR